MLAKAEPNCDGGSTSGITWLRGKKPHPAQEQLHLKRAVGERERNVRETALKTTRSVEGGTGGAPITKSESALQTVVQTMVSKLCPSSLPRSMVDHRSISRLWRTQRWVLREVVTLWKAWTGAGF